MTHRMCLATALLFTLVFGCSEADEGTPPVAAFSMDSSSGPAYLTVQFTDETMSETAISAWSWDFGDGDGSANQHPQHT